MRRLLIAFVLAACASTVEPGWRNDGDFPFENAKARCQIETQTVDGAAWETCMRALGWTRRPDVRSNNAADLLALRASIR